MGNKHGSTTIIAAITTTLKKYPITVLLSPQEGGLKEPSMANLAQILTIDKSRLIKKLGALDTAKLQEIDAAVMISLGIGL
ncbi:MAG: type II toxin-antitoxin system PemK/MazF family toxin [Nitrospirota bacterium]